MIPLSIGNLFGPILMGRYGIQIGVQLVIGLAVTVFPAATAAFALGLSEKDELTGRVARNESFTHFGNAVYALLVGAIGSLVSLAGIFYAAAVFASGMIFAAMRIDDSNVNYEAARQGKDEAGGTNEGNRHRKGFRDLIADKRILIFTATVVLFNVSNAATLPLVSQILSREQHGSSAAWQPPRSLSRKP